MSSSDDYPEIDIEETANIPLEKLLTTTKHHKGYSETVSTNSCTIDLDQKPIFHRYSSSKFTDVSECTQSYKSIKSKAFDLPDRLNNFKQVSENKIKFMKVEKEIKELEQCTFQPKTNVKAVKTSLSQFCKQQQEYMKSKNSAILKLKFLYKNADSSRNVTPGVKALKPASKTIGSAHERLYKQSKIFPRMKKA